MTAFTVDIEEYYPPYRLDPAPIDEIMEAIGANKDYDDSAVFVTSKMRPIVEANGITEWIASREQCNLLRDLAYLGKLKRPKPVKES